MVVLAVAALWAAGAAASVVSAAETPAGEKAVVAGDKEGAGGQVSADSTRTIALAAAIAFVTAVSILGSALAVGKIGAAALGAAAEKPELLTRSLLFVALAEGLAVLGFAVAMLLMAKI
jgi:V/A-type H+-transporting ATPase subunit K